MSDSTDVTLEFEPYDSEILKIEQVIEALNVTRRTKDTSVEGWRNEISDRFFEAGFKVNITLYEVEGVQVDDGPIKPVKGKRIHTVISIEGRADDMKVGEYDHERQGAEIRANIRGLASQPTPDKKVSVQMPGLPQGMTTSSSGLIVPSAGK